MLRRRKSTLKTVKELDAFPKVPESYTKTTSSGGTISIFCFIVITILIISEVRYYRQTSFKFKYGVDTDFDSKLKINVDMTIAMPCEAIGADVLDVTNQVAQTYGDLQEEGVNFALTDNQREIWNSLKAMNRHIRKQYHSLRDVILRAGMPKLIYSDFHKFSNNKLPDACRLHGTLQVNKLAGNFHITAGKLLPSFGIHAHLAMFLRDTDYNFSHRIESLSFGDEASGIFHPLNGDEKMTDKNFMVYTYFIKVVPTEVETFSGKINTFQYSVTEQVREVNHHQGSHGIPGIFFKYDMSSVKVHIKEDRQPLWQFMVRLCGIVGGIFATSGIINGLIGSAVDFVCCNLKKRESLSADEETFRKSVSMPDSQDVFSSATADTSIDSGYWPTTDKPSVSSLSDVDEIDNRTTNIS